jgi:hypothetical protein
MPSPATSRHEPDAVSRVVLLYLLGLSAAPVEGEDLDPADDRPPLYLSRAALAEDWEAFATRSRVRSALRITRPSARSLGPRGLFRVLDGLAASLAAAEVERASAEVEDLRAEVRAEEEAARAQGREQDRDTVRFLRSVRRSLADAEDALDQAARRGRDLAPVSTRTHGRAASRRDRFLVRLLRDDPDAWETALSLFADADADADDDDLDALLAEAAELGFVRSEPIPSAWTRDVRARSRDDDDQADADEPAPADPKPEPVEEPVEQPADVERAPHPLRPTFTAPPVEPLPDLAELRARRSRAPVERPRETPEESWARVERERQEAAKRREQARRAEEADRLRDLDRYRPECPSCGNLRRRCYCG